MARMISQRSLKKEGIEYSSVTCKTTILWYIRILRVLPFFWFPLYLFFIDIDGQASLYMDFSLSLLQCIYIYTYIHLFTYLCYDFAEILSLSLFLFLSFFELNWRYCHKFAKISSYQSIYWRILRGEMHCVEL